MKLATIERIIKLTPIEGADKIILATILGWEVVVKKMEFKVGDFCVYIPIDTQVDTTRSCFAFLSNGKKQNHIVRIKTTKLKGKWSQGLALPLNCLSSNIQYNESDDVSEQLGVTKYEKENISVSLGTTKKLIDFPTYYISKTDEDNLKTKYKVIEEFIDKKVYISQKMDGSSMTIIWDEPKENFLVCSRNLILESDSVMYQYVDKIKIKKKIVDFGHNLAIQGEFSGPKINGNSMGLKDYNFYVFTIKNLDTANFYGLEKIKEITEELGLQMVPIVGIYHIDESWTLEKFQTIANEQTYTQSNNKKVPGEGIVVRPIEPVFSQLLGKMLSVKIINQNYKD